MASQPLYYVGHALDPPHTKTFVCIRDCVFNLLHNPVLTRHFPCATPSHEGPEIAAVTKTPKWLCVNVYSHVTENNALKSRLEAACQGLREKQEAEREMEKVIREFQVIKAFLLGLIVSSTASEMRRSVIQRRPDHFLVPCYELNRRSKFFVFFTFH